MLQSVLQKADFDDFFDKNYYTYIASPLLRIIKQLIASEWESEAVQKTADIITIILVHQLKSVSFLTEAEDSVVLIAWTVKQIKLYGPCTRTLAMLASLFNVSDLPLSTSDLGRIINLTYMADIKDILKLHLSLLRWGHHSNFIKTMCKSGFI